MFKATSKQGWIKFLEHFDCANIFCNLNKIALIQLWFRSLPILPPPLPKKVCHCCDSLLLIFYKFIDFESFKYIVEEYGPAITVFLFFFYSWTNLVHPVKLYTHNHTAACIISQTASMYIWLDFIERFLPECCPHSAALFFPVSCY